MEFVPFPAIPRKGILFASPKMSDSSVLPDALKTINQSSFRSRNAYRLRASIRATSPAKTRNAAKKAQAIQALPGLDLLAVQDLFLAAMELHAVFVAKFERLFAGGAAAVLAQQITLGLDQVARGTTDVQDLRRLLRRRCRLFAHRRNRLQEVLAAGNWAQTSTPASTERESPLAGGTPPGNDAAGNDGAGNKGAGSGAAGGLPAFRLAVAGQIERQCSLCARIEPKIKSRLARFALRRRRRRLLRRRLGAGAAAGPD